MTPQAVASHSAAPRVKPVAAATRGRYVALGDSFASGTTGDGACHRTTHVYPHQVAEKFDFTGTTRFAACSGATLAGLTAAHGEREAQVSRVDAKTGLVTVQAGGNDLGFSSVLATCVLQSAGSSACRAQEPHIRHQAGRLRADLGTVLDRIRSAAPRARVLVVGYPHLFAAKPKAAVAGIAPRDQRWLNKMTDVANTALRAVAGGRDARIGRSGRGSVEFVDVAQAFAGHEMGRSKSYVRDLRVDYEDLAVNPGSFHPTDRGQARLAKAVIAQLRAGPDRALR